jgi:hypothetical protein
MLFYLALPSYVKPITPVSESDCRALCACHLGAALGRKRQSPLLNGQLRKQKHEKEDLSQARHLFALLSHSS